MKIHHVLFFIFLFCSMALASAAPIFPRLTGQIVDRAKILSMAEKTDLLQKLQSLEKKSSDQLVIVTLPSLQGYTIANFSNQLARHWKIGQKGTDNGVLLVIAPKERKMRIEVGYGLEGTLTDILAHTIIQKSIQPHFKKGKLYQGISSGTNDIIKVLLGNADEVKQRLSQKTSKPDNSGWLIFLFFIFPLLISPFGFLNIFSGARGNKRGGGVYILPAAQKNNNNHHSTGYSGGWSNGGGGGGFSGGGGSFGGGGASGGW